MEILDEIRVSKLSAKVFFYYFFKRTTPLKQTPIDTPTSVNALSTEYPV